MKSLRQIAGRVVAVSWLWVVVGVFLWVNHGYFEANFEKFLGIF
jgi:hypothetical protein